MLGLYRGLDSPAPISSGLSSFEDARLNGVMRNSPSLSSLSAEEMMATTSAASVKRQRARRNKCYACKGCLRRDNCGVCSVCLNPGNTTAVCKEKRCEANLKNKRRKSITAVSRSSIAFLFFLFFFFFFFFFFCFSFSRIWYQIRYLPRVPSSVLSPVVSIGSKMYMYGIFPLWGGGGGEGGEDNT